MWNSGASDAIYFHQRNIRKPEHEENYDSTYREYLGTVDILRSFLLTNTGNKLLFQVARSCSDSYSRSHGSLGSTSWKRYCKVLCTVRTSFRSRTQLRVRTLATSHGFVGNKEFFSPSIWSNDREVQYNQLLITCFRKTTWFWETYVSIPFVLLKFPIWSYWLHSSNVTEIEIKLPIDEKRRRTRVLLQNLACCATL